MKGLGKNRFSIGRFSVSNPVLVNLLTVLVYVLGFVALRSLPRDLMPKVDFDMVTVSVVYPGASAEVVEKQVTIPVEDAIKPVKNIRSVTSLVSEGSSFTFIEVRPGADVDDVYQDVADAIRSIRDLPDDAEEPKVKKLEVEVPVIRYAIAGRSHTKVREVAKSLEDLFRKVKGVSSIALSGYRNGVVYVDVSPDILEKYQVSLFQIANAIKGALVDAPAGSVSIGSKRYTVRTTGRIRTPGQVKDVIVRVNEDGVPLRVKDIARVRYGYEEAKVLYRAEGKEAIFLTVYKKPEGDAISIADSVKKKVASFRQALKKSGKDVEILLLNDLSYFVRRRLNTVASNAVMGFVLVFVTLMLLLNRRIAFMTALGIPFAVFSTFLIMDLMGLTLNMVSMFGLIVVLGMLVDDGIIIAENVYRHLEEGVSPEEAAIVGTDEVVKPVFSSVITTVAAFSPLLFMGGIMGRFVMAIPLVVIAALLSSLLEAYVVLPSHLSEFAVSLGHSHAKKKFKDSVTAAYRKVLEFLLKHRRAFIVSFAVLLVFSVFFAVKFMNFRLFTPSEVKKIELYVEMPEGTSLERTLSVVEKMEKLALPYVGRDLESVVSVVGTDSPRGGGFGKQETNLAIVSLNLLPSTDRERDVREIVSWLKSNIRRMALGKYVRIRKEVHGPKAGKPVEVRLSAPSFKDILPALRELESFLSRIDGVYDVSDDFIRSRKELVVKIDPLKAARMNIDPVTVASTLRAIDGIEATKIRYSDESISVKIRYLPEIVSSRNFLRRLKIANRYGMLIPLANFATFREVNVLPYITRTDFSRTVTVTAEVDNVKATSRKVASLIKKEFMPEAERKYPSVSISFGGEFFSMKESFKELGRAFLYALTFILLILTATFGSVADTLIVASAIPMGVIGVIWALFFHGLPVDFLSLMSLVALSGVVVNDSIVLVDFINRAVRNGVPLKEAVLESGIKRFRPVFLTTFTTAAGLFSTAYGLMGSDPMLRPFALSFMWGLVFATTLTLLFVPVLYFSVHNFLAKIRLKI